jgi:hypothetical protein
MLSMNRLLRVGHLMNHESISNNFSRSHVEHPSWRGPPEATGRIKRSRVRAPSWLRPDHQLQAIEPLRLRCAIPLTFLSLQPCRPCGHAARRAYEAQPGGGAMLLSLQHTRRRLRTSE